MAMIMRQLGKKILTMLLVLGIAVMPFGAGAASLVTAVVNDPLTGVAVDGYDPVSFFTDAEPLRGRPDFEFQWSGVPWYFASAANRDVFMRAPEIYAPQFGGHDAMALSRGYLSDGDPRLHAIVGQRLFLFYSPGNREAFLLAPGPAYREAQARWPAIRAQLQD